jgi:hypothetical protein
MRESIFGLFSEITTDKNLDALDEYKSFLMSFGDRGTKPKKGFNLHHILPRLFFRKNQIANTHGIEMDDERNLILLTPYEHFKAHVLLIGIFPHNYGLNSYVIRVFKFFGSIVDDPDFETIFTEVYTRACDEIRGSFSALMKRRWADPKIREEYIQMGKDKWANPEYRAKMSGDNSWFHTHKPRKGRITSEETRKKQSQTRIEKGLSRGDKNPRYGKKWDEAHRKEMSERQKGNKSHRWEVPHTQETRHKMSEFHKEMNKRKRQEKESAIMAETMGFLF